MPRRPRMYNLPREEGHRQHDDMLPPADVMPRGDFIGSPDPVQMHSPVGPEKESEYWQIPEGAFPLFPKQRGFDKIPKKVGKIGGVRLAKKISGKFRDEMVRMPDGRIDSTPYDNQKFNQNDIEELYGPGDYKTTLYADVATGGAEIWSSYWTITGGEVRPFPCCIPPSEQGFPQDMDEDPRFNPTQIMNDGEGRGGRESREEREREREFERGTSGPPGSGLFDNQSPFGGGPPGGIGGFGPRPSFGRQQEPEEDKTEKLLKTLGVVLAAVAPIVTPIIASMSEKSRLQIEMERQRMEREEERIRQREEDRKREREHEIRMEEEREARRREEAARRASEERQRMEWEDRRRREEEDRQRNREDYENTRRRNEEERQAKLDEQRREILRNQYEQAKPHVDPQIVAMVTALNNKIDAMQKVGPLGGLKQTLAEFSQMRDELEALGLAGGSAPQGEGGIESFLGKVVGSIPPERAAALIKTVGSAIGMLPPEAALPSEIPLG